MLYFLKWSENVCFLIYNNPLVLSIVESKDNCYALAIELKKALQTSKTSFIIPICYFNQIRTIAKQPNNNKLKWVENTFVKRFQNIEMLQLGNKV